jgi:hypothetical protein
MISVLSFVEEHERIFGGCCPRWSSCSTRKVDRDEASEAWVDGYSAAEHAAHVKLGPRH